jgi:hypothetical protein
MSQVENSQMRPAESGGKRVLFPSCTVSDSLVEPLAEAARNATSGDAATSSPACSDVDQFRPYQQWGEVICPGAKSIRRGAGRGYPNMIGRTVTVRPLNENAKENLDDLLRGFSDEKPRGKRNENESTH